MIFCFVLGDVVPETSRLTNFSDLSFLDIAAGRVGKISKSLQEELETAYALSDTIFTENLKILKPDYSTKPRRMLDTKSNEIEYIPFDSQAEHECIQTSQNFINQ